RRCPSYDSLRGRSHAHRVQRADPVTDIGAVVMPGTAAEEIAVYGKILLGIDAAADFQIEPAFRHAGHAAASHAVRARGYLHPVADAGDRLGGIEEVPRNPDEILVIPNVFGSTATAEEDAEIVFRLHVAERDVRLDRIPFELAGDVPAAFGNFMENHVVATLLRARHHRHHAFLPQAEDRIERVHRFGGVPDNDKNPALFSRLGHNVSSSLRTQEMASTFSASRNLWSQQITDFWVNPEYAEGDGCRQAVAVGKMKVHEPARSRKRQSANGLPHRRKYRHF